MDYYTEKELKIKECSEHWHKVEDPIQIQADVIDFAFACSDWWAIFGNAFKDEEAFIKWFNADDDNQFSGNLLFNIYTRELTLVIILPYHAYYTVLRGAGGEYLKCECETACKNETGKSCKEFAEEA